MGKPDRFSNPPLKGIVPVPSVQGPDAEVRRHGRPERQGRGRRNFRQPRWREAGAEDKAGWNPENLRVCQSWEVFAFQVQNRTEKREGPARERLRTGPDGEDLSVPSPGEGEIPQFPGKSFKLPRTKELGYQGQGGHPGKGPGPGNTGAEKSPGIVPQDLSRVPVGDKNNKV